MLIWLPFGLITRKLPPDLFSMLIGLVFGYIIGHVLQGLASKAFPPKIKGKDGKLYSPSDLLLNNNDCTFSPDLKTRILKKIKAELNIDARSKDDHQEEFMLCRAKLYSMKCPSYAEQFEGMYAFMRGIMTAFLLGGLFNFGWGLSKFFMPYRFSSLFQIVALSFLIICFVLILIQSITYWKKTKARTQTKPKDGMKFLKDEKGFFWVPMILMIILGIYFGSKEDFCVQSCYLFFGIGLICIFIFFRCYAAYLDFAKKIKKTVYQDFVLISEYPNAKRQVSKK